MAIPCNQGEGFTHRAIVRVRVRVRVEGDLAEGLVGV